MWGPPIELSGFSPKKSPPRPGVPNPWEGAFQDTFRQDRDFRSSLDVGRQKLQARSSPKRGRRVCHDRLGVCPTPRSVPCYGSCKTQPGTCRNRGVNRSLFTFQQNKKLAFILSSLHSSRYLHLAPLLVTAQLRCAAFFSESWVQLHVRYIASLSASTASATLTVRLVQARACLALLCSFCFADPGVLDSALNRWMLSTRSLRMDHGHGLPPQQSPEPSPGHSRSGVVERVDQSDPALHNAASGCGLGPSPNRITGRQSSCRRISYSFPWLRAAVHSLAASPACGLDFPQKSPSTYSPKQTDGVRQGTLAKLSLCPVAWGMVSPGS